MYDADEADEGMARVADLVVKLQDQMDGYQTRDVLTALLNLLVQVTIDMAPPSKREECLQTVHQNLDKIFEQKIVLERN